MSPSLRQLLRKRALVVPGVTDCLTAFLAKKTGSKAMYLTGAGLSVTHLGLPDAGFLTLDHVADATQRISQAVPLPLIVDADTAYGNTSSAVTKTVRRLEAAGAAAIQIEDQEFPKRCGHLEGKSLVNSELMARKIRAAVKARRNRNTLIIARTDARGVTGVSDTLRRATEYKAAGADVIFLEALQSWGEYRFFGTKKNLGFLMANMTEFGRSPALPANELSRLGFRLIIYPMTAFRITARAVQAAFYRLKHNGTTRSLLDRMQTRQELYKLIGYDDFDRWRPKK